jgi:hypothetical protein
VNWLHDPIYSRITANGSVLWVNQDDFKVFVGRILIDPVGIQHSEICATTTNTFFGCGSERSLVFELVDTLVGGFA